MNRHPVYLKRFDGQQEVMVQVPEEFGGHEEVVDEMERSVQKAYELGRRHQLEIMSVLLTEQVDVVRRGEIFDRDKHDAISQPVISNHGVEWVK